MNTERNNLQRYQQTLIARYYNDKLSDEMKLFLNKIIDEIGELLTPPDHTADQIQDSESQNPAGSDGVIKTESTKPEDKAINLLKCPFCNSTAEWINEIIPDGHFYIRCTSCLFIMKADRRDKVIGMWNRRHAKYTVYKFGSNDVLMDDNVISSISFEEVADRLNSHSELIKENERLKSALRSFIDDVKNHPSHAAREHYRPLIEKAKSTLQNSGQ